MTAWRRREDVVSRQTATGLVLWPLGRSEPLFLSPLPALVWEHLDETRDIDALVALLADEGEDRADVRGAMQGAIDVLDANNLIVDTSPS